MITTRRILLNSAAVALAASLAAPSASLASEPLRVVATFSILGDMVANIGGDEIALTTLVGPDGDAHVYQPTPQNAAAVSRADVLIVNGLDFEGWLERLVEASGFDGTLVVATDGIDAIAYDEDDDHDGEHDDDHAHDDHAAHDHDDDHDDQDHEDHASADHDHDHDNVDQASAGHDHHDDHAEDAHEHDEDDHAAHDHHHGAFDPHAWQSVENALIYVDNITAGLSVAAPDRASAFYTNRAAYVDELEALDVEITAMMASVPDDRRTVVTAHDAFGYFAAAFDITFLSPQGISTDAEASAADVAALITQIREQGIAAVFVENITDNRLLEQVANETGASIGGALFSGALSGPSGPAASYIDMMRHNVMTITEALGS